jgi:hypothetical protein
LESFATNQGPARKSKKKVQKRLTSSEGGTGTRGGDDDEGGSSSVNVDVDIEMTDRAADE